MTLYGTWIEFKFNLINQGLQKDATLEESFVKGKFGHKSCHEAFERKV
jgi:hypothetical protein